MYSKLLQIINEFKILDGNSFSFKNEKYEFMTSSNYLDTTQIVSYGAPNILEIRDYLYNIYHCRKNNVFESPTTNQLGIEDQEFVASLSEANKGHGSSDLGWIVSKINNENQIVVQKDGLSLWAHPEEFQSYEKKLEVGVEGYLGLPKEMRRMSPGFYVAISNVPVGYSEIPIRIYWNIQYSGASLLVENITTELNKKGIPFQFKVLNNPNQFSRSDAAVLYLDKKDVQNITSELSTIYQRVKKYLNPQTSLFTKKLTDGVTLAEELISVTGESFGQQRSHLLAFSLCEIYRNSLTNSEDQIAEMITQFQKAGVDISKPYLNNSLKDDYERFFDGVFD